MRDTTHPVPPQRFPAITALVGACAVLFAVGGCSTTPSGPQAAETQLTTPGSALSADPLDIHILGSAAQVTVLPLPAEEPANTGDVEQDADARDGGASEEPVMIKVTSDNDRAALPLVTQPSAQRYEVRSDLGDEAGSSHITVLLHADATWNVSLDAPVDTFTADFATLNVDELHLSESVATATVTTPHERDINIEQSGGAGQVTVIAPAGATPNVIFNVGYGQADIDGTTFTSGEEISLPTSEADGSPQITVSHTAGIGQFTLQRR
ncbi:hypothetical protein [Jonesia quinghaiensis]|uniref:hypothetical protein n=1 Tax=Jonesia quinghaiensis TaxID=262806 RepID=UPI0004174FC6|nr:hypothetical protein [Jonesia quinghaiensis]